MHSYLFIYFYFKASTRAARQNRVDRRTYAYRERNRSRRHRHHQSSRRNRSSRDRRHRPRR